MCYPVLDNYLTGGYLTLHSENRYLPTHLTYLPVPYPFPPRREVLRPRPSSSSSPHGSALTEERRFPGLANRSELQ
jgi:hypothetical protein